MINIEEAVKEHLRKFYSKKRYPQQPEIDFPNMRVQVEEFGWKTASYRIDAFFHQQPSFLPYHQNFRRWHKLFMTKTGEVIKNEIEFTTWGNHPDEELRKKRFKEIIGFYPGNYYFKKEMHFIDEVIKKSAPFNVTSGPDDFFKSSFQFVNGILDLEKIEANIIQQRDGYKIIFEAEKYEPTSGLFMYDISFEINNYGICSKMSKEMRDIPGLC